MDCNLTLHGSQSLTHCQPCYKDSLQPEISVKSSSIVKTCSGPSDVCRGGGGGDGDHCIVLSTWIMWGGSHLCPLYTQTLLMADC